MVSFGVPLVDCGVNVSSSGILLLSSWFVRYLLILWLSAPIATSFVAAQFWNLGTNTSMNLFRFGPFTRKVFVVLQVLMVKGSEFNLSDTLMTSLQMFLLVS